MELVEFECSPSITAVFTSLAGLRGRFLLEDVGAGTALIGAEPEFVLSAKNGVVTESAAGIRAVEVDPLDALKSRLARYRRDEPVGELPFAGGAVGYFSYDLGRSIERIPEAAAEDVPTPDYCLGFYDSALWIDLGRRRCTAVSWSGDRTALDFWKKLALAAPQAGEQSNGQIVHCPGSPEDMCVNFTRRDYLSTVNAIKDYIAAGDVYQVNLAQRFEAELTCSPWELYEALRRVNPAPKSCYMELGSLILASASPEVFLTYDPATRIATTKPIKGTRPRGCDEHVDACLAAELAASEKDRAENLMIVDMERNDLGRVAKYGSVHVPKLWEIEAHPNVFQMVSTVEAEIAEGYGPVDLLKACFPGGSITGAPKIRAMEIIEELEPHRRGIYTG